MDLASVVAALASVGVRVSGSTPNNNIQVDSSRACPTGLAGPEPSGTHNDPGQHFHAVIGIANFWCVVWFHGTCGIQTSRRVSGDYICLNSGVILSTLLQCLILTVAWFGALSRACLHAYLPRLLLVFLPSRICASVC